MLEKIEHIGIAVSDLETAIPLYTRLLNVEPYKTEKVEAEGVITVFFKTAGQKIELLQGTKDGNTISRFIQVRGEGLHHIAFEVNDIKQEMQRLKTEGFTLLRDEPFKGADNKMVCFVHPSSAGHVLWELCEEIK